MDKASTFQNAIKDGSRQSIIVQHLSPLSQWLVGGKDHRSFPEMAFIDYVEQDVGSIWAIGQVPNFVAEQNVRSGVGQQRRP